MFAISAERGAVEHGLDLLGDAVERVVEVGGGLATPRTVSVSSRVSSPPATMFSCCTCSSSVLISRQGRSASRSG